MSRRKPTTAERHARRAHRKAPDFSDEQWADVQRRAGYRCYLCGRFSRHLEVEHLIPIARGGSNAIYNIAPACHACNQAKGNRSVYQLLNPREVADLHRRLHARQHPDSVILDQLGLRLARDYALYRDPAAAYALSLLFAITGEDRYNPAYIDQAFPQFLASLRASTKE